MQTEGLTEQFEEQRSRLRAIAYRMLGSFSEADDAVQETWLRLNRTGTDEIENLAAWLTTVVTRVCLNMLAARKTRREESLETVLPEPAVSMASLDPEHEALLADSVGFGHPDMSSRSAAANQRWASGSIRSSPRGGFCAAIA